MTVSAARMKELSYLEMMRDFRKTKERYQMASGADEINLCFRVYGDAMEELGICVIGIARQGAEDIFDEISNYSHGNWIVTDQNRNILISGEKGKAADELNSLDMNFSGKKGSGEPAPVRVKKLGFGTYAGVSVGMDNIYVILKPTMATFFAVVFLALIFIGAAMFGISLRFTRPLKTLADNLKAFGKKDLDVRMEDSSISEIHEISLIFNEMAERIQYLIVTEVYEKQLLAARSQTKYLQAQINPHFQFNILSMFSIRAKLAGNEELYKGLQAFSGLMRGKIFREKKYAFPYQRRWSW